MQKGGRGVELFVSSLGAALLLLGAIPCAQAFPTTFAEITALTSPWLFIGTGSVNDSTTPEGKANAGIGHAVDISNFEIGANKAPVPANQFKPDQNLDFGPDLKMPDVNTNSGKTPRVPGVHEIVDPLFGTSTIEDPSHPAVNPGPDGIVGVLPDPHVITYDGQVAITAVDGTMNMGDTKHGMFGVSNVGVFAKNQSDGGPVPDTLPPGIVCAGDANTDASAGGCIANNSNSYFNDEEWPNPIGDPDEGSPDPSNALEPGNGISGQFDFSALRTALDVALEGDATFPGIRNLTGAAPQFCKLEIDSSDTFIDVCNGNTLDLTGQAGQIRGDDLDIPTTLYVKLNDGLNIIDFETGSHDLLLNNANIIVDGSENAAAIFRVPEEKNFNINQGNILIGDMGIMNMNVMFFSDTEDQQATFTFNDTIFNGIQFWTLGDGSGIHVNNSQGCVQMVGDKINLQNVRYTQCAFKAPGQPGEQQEEVPEPGTLGLAALGLGLIAVARRRQAKSA